MKTAKSLIYGGELIDAIDCDYDDFLDLVPLCPNCNEPVFLRKESDRVSKFGKKFQVPRHWVHFDSTSEEQKASCEKRVGSYTEADRQRIQSQARGQRLKLIQRWFWKAFLHGVPVTLDGNPITEQSIADQIKTLSFRQAQHHLVSCFLRSIHQPSFEDLIERRLKEAFDLKQNMVFEKKHETFVDKAHASLSSIDRQLHGKICREIILFLSTKKQRSSLSKMISLGGALTIRNLMTREKLRCFPGNPALTDLFAMAATANTIGLIAITPWASEFERLEDSAGKTKSSLKIRI